MGARELREKIYVITIEARNVNDALWAGGSMLRQMGVERQRIRLVGVPRRNV